MPEIAAAVIFTFLAIFGLAELIFRIKEKLFEPVNTHSAIVISCEGHDEEIEYSLRALVNREEDLRSGERLIIVIDKGMDEETRTICQKISEEFGGIEVCKISELPNVFERQLQI